jgi:hypothetical protein
MSNVFMECGCVAHATHGNEHDTLSAGHPTCITHGNCTIVGPFDLTDRQARCSCNKITTSSPDLPFFEFRGVDSPSSKDKCKCGYHETAHWPLWKADIKYVRRWFKIERSEGTHSFTKHLPDKETAELWAALQPERWLNWTNNPETKVFEAELIGVHQVRNPLKCKRFAPHGPYPFDSYYCGHGGWD